MADGKVVYQIEGDSSQAMKALDKFERAAEESGKNVEDAVKEHSDNVESAVSSTAAKIAKAIGSAFAVKKIVDFGKAAVTAASNLEEVQNVVDTTFGEGAPRIDEWAAGAAEAFGESELQAKQFTSTIGAMFKSMGVGQHGMEEMFIALAGLSGDMASFYNLDPTEAFEKLRSGISGETEPLKQLGINMSVVNLEAFALSEGITKSYDSMTQAEQATLRYQYIMSATADAQGDFSNTSDSLANQQRILKLEMETLAGEIGQDLMPMALELVSAARDAIEWGREHKEVLEGLAGAVGVTAAAYAAWKITLKAEEAYDAATSGAKMLTKALAGARGAGSLAAAASSAETAASGMGTTLLGAIGPAGWATVAVIAGIALIIAAVENLKAAEEEAMQKQIEYMDGLTTLADYRANGLVSTTGATYNEATRRWEGGTTTIDYEEAERMKEAGSFKSADRSEYKQRDTSKVYTISELASPRFATGKDFVMSDWTPAYLDYGERVLTREENIQFNTLGGLQGMDRALSEPQYSTPSTASGGKMQIGLKVTPREMAHAITPYIVEEMKANDIWRD